MRKGVRLNNLLQLFFLSCLFLIFWGCSGVPYYPPVNNSGSEALGEGNSVHMTYGQTQKMEFSDDLTADTPTGNRKFVSDSAFSFHYRKSFFPQFDLETSFGPRMPFYVGGKIQLVGQGQNSGGGFSMALRFGGSIFISFDDSQNNANGTERKLTYNGLRTPLELLAGYRVFDWYLVYFSAGIASYDYYLDWRGDEEIEDIEFSGSHTFYSFGNVFYFSGFSVLLGFSYDSVTVDEQDGSDIGELSFSTTLGYKF